ncbi:MAG: hypothetical protein H7267_05465, partial [Sandarakinorhabdus sp.]|nr:hypothetical protein [Sandarakinorhabdus sp.]
VRSGAAKAAAIAALAAGAFAINAPPVVTANSAAPIIHAFGFIIVSLPGNAFRAS